MKTDLYTKIILTVIAVCLTVSLLKEFEIIPTAKATTATIPAPILTATQSTPVDVNIVQIDGKRVRNSNGYLEIGIQYNLDK